MFGGWRALRESLVLSVGTLAAHNRFREVTEEAASLGRFNDPLGLIDFLAIRPGDLDEKDRIYAALVTAAQSGGPCAQLASTLLLLGLWPGLDAIYRQKLRRFSNDPDELVAQIAAQFTAAVHRLRLRRVSRIAATLTMNTDRLVGYRCAKQEQADKLREELPEDNLFADGRDPLGEQSIEEERAACSRLLVQIVGARDAELLIATELDDETQRAFAKRKKLSEVMVRKRHQRALKKLRDRCPSLRPRTAFPLRRR